MEQDTAIGGPHNRFPSTRRSVIRAASQNGQAEERTYATGLLITAYWKPVYKYIRVQWRQSNEDAKDLTQAFFVECETAGKALHYRLFERYDLSEDEARPTYPDLAREFALPVTQVTNHLASVRRLFRRTLLEKLRELTADEREFRNEARALLGVIIS